MEDQFAPPPPPESPGAPPPPPPPPGEPGSFSPPAAGGYGGPPTGGGYTPPPGDHSYQQPTQAPGGKGGGKKTIIIVIVAILLLCCCGTLIGGYLLLQNTGDIGRSLSGDAPPAVSITDDGPIGDAGPPAVWLSWSDPVDMDLEIWDASGDSMISAAYYYSGDDQTTGGIGDEYFEFTTYSDQDFSFGDYIVSVYYVGSDSGADPDATVRLKIKDAEGSVQTLTKTIKWDPGYDQWHAVRINGSTGEVTVLDEWY